MKPYQLPITNDFNSGMLLSATVGIDGAEVARRALVTATARKRPVEACGKMEGAELTTRSTCPAAASLTAGAQPR